MTGIVFLKGGLAGEGISGSQTGSDRSWVEGARTEQEGRGRLRCRINLCGGESAAT